MRKRRTETQNPISKNNEDYNTAFFEPSGLVSDPIPQSERPHKGLSETGEIRLEELKRELFEEAAKKANEPDDDETASTKDANSDLDDDDLDDPAIREVLFEETASSENELTPAVDAMVLTGRIPVITSDGKVAVEADDDTSSDTEQAQQSAEAGTDTNSGPEGDNPTGNEQGKEVDPWIQDLIDEQQSKSKEDFSKYRGQFARLNDFAVPGARGVTTVTSAEREDVIEGEVRRESDDTTRFVDGGEVENAHPRELLSAKMYDDLINWSSRLARETPLFHRAFSVSNITSVCDVGCGSGRHCVLFAEWGLQVIGLDSNQNMLKRARAFADESADEILDAKGSVTFKKSQLGEVAKTVGPEGVDAVVCMGDVLPRVASLTMLREALNDFGDVLKSSGVLVLEFTNHTHYLQNNIRTTTPVVFDTVDGTKVFLGVMDYHGGNVTIDTENLSLTHTKDGRWRARSEHVENLFISPEGIDRELLDAGFDIIEKSGDFAGKQLDSLADESIIIIARRKRHRKRHEVV